MLGYEGKTCSDANCIDGRNVSTCLIVYTCDCLPRYEGKNCSDANCTDGRNVSTCLIIYTDWVCQCLHFKVRFRLTDRRLLVEVRFKLVDTF